MAITYTTNLSLAKPPEGHTDWADDINTNWDTLDAIFDAGSDTFVKIAGDTMTGNLTLEGAVPILVFKDNTDTGDLARGYQEWRGSNNVRLGFFGNHSYTNDDLMWKNESSGGHLLLETTGTGNVGIGTTNPGAKLHLNSIASVTGEDILILENDMNNANEYIGQLFKTAGGLNYGAIRTYVGGTGDSYMSFLTTTDAGVNLVQQLTIQHDGNVGIGTNAPTSALQMGDDKLIAVDVNAGLTASTTQEQGQGALTAQANEISTVANKDDTVTLPSAVTGIEVEIINNGANTLWIFPASGDDMGLGVNTAEELESNERVKFVAYDTTNWAKESTTEIIHAEIHDEDNIDAFVVNAQTDFHSYHTNGLAAGDLADWTFDAGGAGTSHAIASIADGADSGVDIAVTTGDNHLLEDGDIVSQTNLTSAVYTGIFVVKDIISPTVYEVAAVYTATDTGTMDQAATLEADAVAAGVYDFAYYISASPVSPNETYDFQLYKEVTAITGSKIRRKFGAGGDFGSMAGGGVVAVGNGEKLSFALSNEDSAANLTIRNLTIVLVRL